MADEIPVILPPRSARVDWKIQQGDDAPFAFRVKDKDGNPIPLTGYIVTLVAKVEHGAADRLFLITNDPALLADADAEFSVAPSGDDNLASAELPDEFTAAITWQRGVYDCRLQSPTGQVVRRLRGEIEVLPKV